MFKRVQVFHSLQQTITSSRTVVIIRIRFIQLWQSWMIRFGIPFLLFNATNKELAHTNTHISINNEMLYAWLLIIRSKLRKCTCLCVYSCRHLCTNKTWKRLVSSIYYNMNVYLLRKRYQSTGSNFIIINVHQNINDGDVMRRKIEEKSSQWRRVRNRCFNT